MLIQASVGQIRSGELSRKEAYIVVAMCFYPRGLKRSLIDEYRSDLAPDRKLFAEWKHWRDRVGHENAFKEARYEFRYSLEEEALAHLQELSKKKKDVYIVCQCELGQRCHREMLLLIARERFLAKTSPIYHEYPKFLERVRAGYLGLAYSPQESPSAKGARTARKKRPPPLEW